MSGKIRKNTGYFIGWKKKYRLVNFVNTEINNISKAQKFTELAKFYFGEIQILTR